MSLKCKHVLSKLWECRRSRTFLTPVTTGCAIRNVDPSFQCSYHQFQQSNKSLVKRSASSSNQINRCHKKCHQRSNQFNCSTWRSQQPYKSLSKEAQFHRTKKSGHRPSKITHNVQYPKGGLGGATSTKKVRGYPPPVPESHVSTTSIDQVDLHQIELRSELTCL